MKIESHKRLDQREDDLKELLDGKIKIYCKIENQEGLKLDDEDDSVVFKRLTDQVRGRRSRAVGVWVCGRR